jgi:hypothetical protein
LEEIDGLLRSNVVQPYRVVLSRLEGDTEVVTLGIAGVGAEYVPIEMRRDPVAPELVESWFQG